MANGNKSNSVRCSFCGKTQNAVEKLIAGPGVYICDECIKACNGILEDELYENEEEYTLNENEKLPYQKTEMGRAKSAMFFPLYIDNITEFLKNGLYFFASSSIFVFSSTFAFSIFPSGRTMSILYSCITNRPHS